MIDFNQIVFPEPDWDFSLTILGVSSFETGKSIEDYLRGRIVNVSVEEDDDFYLSMEQFIHKISSPVILPCYRLNTSDESVASNLLFYRDEFFRKKVHLWIICSKDLYLLFLTQYFDFFSRCQYAHLFE